MLLVINISLLRIINNYAIPKCLHFMHRAYWNHFCNYNWGVILFNYFHSMAWLGKLLTLFSLHNVPLGGELRKSVPPTFSWASIQKRAWPHQHPEGWIQLQIQIICLSVLFVKINILVNPRHKELMYYFTHVDVFPFILIPVFSMLSFSLRLPVVCSHVLWLCWPTGWRFLPPCVHQHDCKYILSWWTWWGSNIWEHVCPATKFQHVGK